MGQTMPTKTAPKKPAASKKSAAKSKAPAKAKAPAGSKAPAKSKAKAPAKSKTPAKAAAKSKAPAKSKAAAKAKALAVTSANSQFKNFEPYKPRRGEEYMSDAQLDHFKNILLKWKGELMQEVDRTVTHMKDEAANFPDPADRATQEEEFSLELRTRDRERKLIKKIDSTIERLEQEDYGFCDACGIEIGIKRLEARPTATLCIDCKTLAEIKERQELG
jgi:DnaK suppressor protein